MYHPGMLTELGTDNHTPMKANTVPNDNHLGVLLLLWSKCPYLGIVDNDYLLATEKQCLAHHSTKTKT